MNEPPYVPEDKYSTAAMWRRVLRSLAKNWWKYLLQVFLALGVGFALFKGAAPTPCKHTNISDFPSPSGKWIARRYEQVCGFRMPSDSARGYIAILPGEPDPLYPKDGKPVFSSGRVEGGTALTMSSNDTVESEVTAQWNGDDNLVVITDECQKVCLVNEKGELLDPVCDSLCRMLTPFEGINITVSAPPPS
ncbi:MAG: hypothetical protein AB7H77_02540 [Bdellovibrionales bacterium]